jgi:hypothetical protein
MNTIIFLLLTFFTSNTTGLYDRNIPDTVYNNSLGFKSTYLSAISYCPEMEVKEWNCYWCSKFGDFKVIETFWDHRTSTFCYFGRINNNGDHVLVFEGSQDEKDLLIDLKFVKLVPYKQHPTAKVHSGFWNAYTSIREEIHTLISSKDITSLFVTGHSLGGALATLASLDIIEERLLANISMVSIGAPRVGNPEYASIYSSLMGSNSYFRLTHALDPIVHLPYLSLDYKHISHEIYYPHDNLDYVECVGGESIRCANSVALKKHNFTDHGYYMNIKISRCSE